jgi:hypothetical protein
LLLAEAEGKLDAGGIFDTSKFSGGTYEYKDIQVTPTASLGKGDRPVFAVSGLNKDGKRITVFTTMGGESVNQAKELVKEGLTYMVGSNLDGDNARMQAEALWNLNAGLYMNGRLEESNIRRLEVGQVATINAPDNSQPMLTVRRTKEGYQVSLADGRSYTDNFPPNSLVPRPNTTGLYGSVDELTIKIGRDFYNKGRK